MGRRSIARIVSCLMGISICCPVRLSVIDRVSRDVFEAESAIASDSGLVGVITEPFRAEKVYAPQVLTNRMYTKFAQMRRTFQFPRRETETSPIRERMLRWQRSRFLERPPQT